MNAIVAIVNKWSGYFLLLCPVLLCAGCNGTGTKSASAADYLAYFSNDKNGLVQKKEISGIVYEIRYLSPEAMALAELQDLNVSGQQLENTVAEYGQMAYFRVRIIGKEGYLFNALKAMGENPDMLENYLNFDAEKDFTAYTPTDTVACGLYSFSRTYGLSADWQLMLAFDLPEWDRKSDLTISYNDYIANSGQLNFRFSGADIANIPKLIY